MNGTTEFVHHALRMSFHWFDYTLFSVMLILSVLIGIYFGFCGPKQSTATEYLMGGKTMRVIPIAISLVASHTSGLTLLALPADVYLHGASYWLGCISLLLMGIATNYIFLPVFYNLNITSTYEYLERRFSADVRRLASLLFALSLFLYLPIVTYIPALAFSQATGISVHYITPLVCSVCIFYTTIGGLKAVVWTDTLQFTITFAAMIVVFALGLKSSGGLSEIWQKSLDGQRLDVFNFSPDPTKRESFWAIAVGLTVHWIAHTSINQGCTQKFLSVSTIEKSKRSVAYYCFGMAQVKTISVFTGLIIYTKYSDCDPLKTKQITKNDQLLPYYIMDVAGNIPGLSGLFIAGVFCASLSTLSANLNCLAGTIYEDFIKAWLTKRGSTATAGYILKLIVVATGVISTVMVLMVERLGGLLELSMGIGSVAHAPLLGMFVLGVLFPPANSKGALYGGISGLCFMSVILSGQNYYKVRGFGPAALPVSTDGCVGNFTLLTDANSTSTTEIAEPMFIFRVTFYFLTMFGTIVTLVVGLCISYLTKNNKEKVDRALLSPIIHCLLKKEQKGEYYDVNKALGIMLINNGGEEARG